MKLECMNGGALRSVTTPISVPEGPILKGILQLNRFEICPSQSRGRQYPVRPQGEGQQANSSVTSSLCPCANSMLASRMAVASITGSARPPGCSERLGQSNNHNRQTIMNITKIALAAAAASLLAASCCPSTPAPAPAPAPASSK